jgi:hypothetical protein
MTMAEVGRKIMAGEILTLSEWDEAREKGILPKDKCHTYGGFLASYYQDDVRFGYICGQHIHRENTDEDGTVWECGWGLHLEELDPEHIRDLNAMYICYHFGRETLRALCAGTLRRKGN